MKKQMTKIILVIMLILTATILTGCENEEKKETEIQPYEEPIKNMIEGMQNTNIEQYMSSLPDFIDYKMTQEKLEQIMNDYEIQYGENVKISYKIIDKQEVKAEKIKEVQENIEMYFEHNCDVTKGYKLNVKQKIEGSKQESEVEMNINVYEIDGKWYRITF